MRKTLVILTACLLVCSLAGCNTVRGFGEDISALGRSLSNATGTHGSN